MCVAKKTLRRAGRSVACCLRAAGLVPGQLCRSAFRMEPFRRLGLSRRIADPDAAGYAGNLQGRAAGPLARPDSVISKRAPDRFFRPGCACRRSSCVPRVRTVRICVRCLGAGSGYAAPIVLRKCAGLWSIRFSVSCPKAGNKPGSYSSNGRVLLQRYPVPLS